MPTKTQAQENGSAPTAIEKANDLLLPAAENAKIVAETTLNMKRSYKRVQLQRTANQEDLSDPVGGMAPDPKGKWTDPETGRKFRTYAQQLDLIEKALEVIKSDHSDLWALVEEKERELAT